MTPWLETLRVWFDAGPPQVLLPGASKVPGNAPVHRWWTVVYHVLTVIANKAAGPLLTPIPQTTSVYSVFKMNEYQASDLQCGINHLVEKGLVGWILTQEQLFRRELKIRKI